MLEGDGRGNKLPFTIDIIIVRVVLGSDLRRVLATIKASEPFLLLGSAGDKVTIKDEEAIMLCTMGKARPAAEKAKAPKNRDSDDAEKLSTR